MAGKVFVGMTGVKFTLDTEVDITGATARVIKFRKPDKTFDTWTAIEEGAPADGNVSFTTTLITHLDTAGRWVFWAKITHSDGTISYGEAEGYTIFPEGK